MKLRIAILVFVLAAGSVLGDGPIKEISLEQVQQVLSKPMPPHPRLFLSDEKLTGLMRGIQASDELKILHMEFLKQADALLSEEPLQRIKTGRRLLSVSREAIRRLYTLSWAFRSSGDQKYLKRGEQEMLAIAEFSDWNPSHFLDVGEMTMAVAVGYDWLYKGLPVSSRQIIRQAIIQKGIQPSLSKDKNLQWQLWWIDTDINWNQVCHGGLTCGALAIAEDEPALARTMIHRSVNKVQIAMNEYEPDGAYPEGPSYWVYGTRYNVLLIDALDSVLGADFGLSKKEGFAKSAEYFLHAIAPTGQYFNYADCGSGGSFVPVVSWFARKYNDPSLLWNEKKRWKHAIKQEPSSLTKDRTSVMTLCWGMPETVRPARLSWRGQGTNPVAMFRTSWDEDAVYLGIKGGSPGSSHAHMDAGSFVIEADGVRWAIDIPREDYHRIESLGIKLFEMGQDSDRWKIFRNNNYSHNTLTVNDQLQRVDGFASIIRYSADKEFPHAVVDLTKVYDGQLKKTVRGAALLPSGQIMIQDQLQAADEPATVRWNMVTPAKVDIQSDTFAILSQKQKTMQFRVVTDADVKLATYSTEPRSDCDSDNGDTRMIGFDVELAANEEVMVRVVMSPGSKQKSLDDLDIGKAQTWSKPLDELNIKER